MKSKYFSNVISKKNSTIGLIKDLFHHLSNRRKRQLYLLLILNLLSGFSESISLGALFPFLAILLSPTTLGETLPGFLLNILPLDDTKFSLTIITLLFIFCSIISSILRLLSLWVNGRVSAAIGSDFGYISFKKILNSSYKKHLEMDSSKNLSTLSLQLNFTVIGINAFLKLITFSVISLAIILFLLFFDFSSAITASIFLTFSYFLLVKLTKRKLISNSKKVTESTKNEISILRESFAFVKQIILDNSQDKYTKDFLRIDIPMRRLQAQNIFLGVSPRYILESLGITFIACLALSFSLQSKESLLLIPTLGTIALGAQKLLPSLQQVYRCWSLIKAYSSDMKNVLEILNLSESNVRWLLTEKSNNIDKNFFKNSLKFKDVSFSYSKKSPLIIKDLNFIIHRGEKIGIVGKTGSGKSTLLDLILTLLLPSKGRIYIDDVEISKGDMIMHWRSLIAHVPQSIFLLNDSISNNICLPKMGEKKNYAKILDVAKKAQIFDFCEGLDRKFETQVGENGVKLSGGQRQRIGIARALYKNAKIIVFDEATSALDVNTEESVMDSISKISRDITVIIVTHRLSSLGSCDRVIKLKNGRLDKIGTSDEILQDY